MLLQLEKERAYAFVVEYVWGEEEVEERSWSEERPRPRRLFTRSIHSHQYRMTWGDIIDQRDTNKDKERSTVL